MTNQTSNSDNSVINAVKRLERAGSEHSNATEKLRKACNRVANFLMNSVPQNLEFGPEVEYVPWNEEVYDEESYERATKLKGPKYYVSWHSRENSDLYNGTVLEMRGQGTIFSDRDWSRGKALEFAEDIANGLLDQAAAVAEADAEKLRAAHVSITQCMGKIETEV